MGFDGFDPVELVMSVEDSLNISIAESDAKHIITAGELLHYLTRRLNAVPTPPTAVCRSARIFRESRKRLAVRFGLEFRTIRPSTLTNDLLPSFKNLDGRRKVWTQILETLNLDAGTLQAPKKIQYAFNLLFLMSPISLVLFSLVVLSKVPREMLPTLLYSYLFAYALLLTSIFWVGRKFASELPSGCRTFGGLIGQLRMTQIQDKPSIFENQWTHAELWELVQDLTAASAGISPNKVKRDTRFMALG